MLHPRPAPRFPALALGLSVLLTASAEAQVEIGPADDVEAAIGQLAPGGELVLRGGTYTLTGRFTFSVMGTEAAPILIRAKAGERPHLHRPLDDQNIIDLDVAEYVTIQGIEFSGGSAGLRITRARALTIQECEIHDTGDVAVRANDSGTYDSLRILRNHIHHTNGTGEGMYLGCNNNACRVANSLIEGNYVHDTNGPSVSQGDGIELKEGGYNNVIRDNVIHDTNYPCILTYSAVGNGAPNIIERNVMWGCGDHGIQSAADAIIRNNIILGAAGDGIAMQPHQAGTPSNLVVVHNTILNATSDAISLRGVTGSVVIANNAAFAQQATAINVVSGNLSGVVVAGNVGQGGVAGVNGGFVAGSIAQDFVAASYSGTTPNDVFPAAGGGLLGAGDSARVPLDDFNGSLRQGVADVGAYAFTPAGNPGWILQPGFKDGTPVVPPPDAGVVDASQVADASPPADGGLGDAASPGDAAAPGDGAAPRDAAAPGDAAAGSDAGRRGDAAGEADAGAGGSGGTLKAGCGCRTTPRPHDARSAVAPWLMLCVLPLVLRRGRAAVTARRREQPPKPRSRLTRASASR
ncbi:MAG: right-handed parallel beta-helix repeat-containing protein [Deltaproteobacteria bacterium]|nr:right-handed parallel beta-helix repeat-containing protein [Deltaproteobacteria bacterium]